MRYFRSYIDKNNTIIKRNSVATTSTAASMNFDNNVNVAKNPITELLYGEYSSKYIFRVNIDDLKENIKNGNYVLTTNTRHYLNLTNCIFADPSFLAQINGKGKERATSFDLIVFPLEEDWEAGRGYDSEKNLDFTVNNKTYDTSSGSNWYHKTPPSVFPYIFPITFDDEYWNEEGIYSDEPSEIIDTVHFDNGDENLHVDITDYLNQILTDERENYGLGIAFHSAYNDIETDLTQSVSFFAANTQTYYEPYVESIFPDDIINDDRYSFIAGQNCDLYLYSVKNGVFQDFNETPLVDIYDSRNQPISGLTNLETIKVRKGVYRVTFKIENSLCDGKKFFYDKWKNIKIYNYDLPTVTKKFTPVLLTTAVKIGSNPNLDTTYNIKISGLQQNEKIKRGDDRRVVINFISINSPTPTLIDNAYYRLYIKENENNKVIVYDWTQMDKTTENSFQLDTSFLIPREYYLDIRADIYGEKYYYGNILKFEIISTRAPIKNTSSFVNDMTGFVNSSLKLVQS